jgi:hypothetical protein
MTIDELIGFEDARIFFGALGESPDEIEAIAACIKIHGFNDVARIDGLRERYQQIIEVAKKYPSSDKIRGEIKQLKDMARETLPQRVYDSVYE